MVHNSICLFVQANCEAEAVRLHVVKLLKITVLQLTPPAREMFIGICVLGSNRAAQIDYHTWHKPLRPYLRYDATPAYWKTQCAITHFACQDNHKHANIMSGFCSCDRKAKDCVNTLLGTSLLTADDHDRWVAHTTLFRPE